MKSTDKESAEPLNAQNFIRRWRETELSAYRKLVKWTEEGKTSFTKQDKKEVLDLLVQHGISKELFILVASVLDVAPATKGRPKARVKRTLIRNFFVRKGSLPPIRNKTHRHKNESYGLIAECAEYLESTLEKKDIPANPQNLISKVLKEPEFRQEVEDLIQITSQSTDLGILAACLAQS